MATKKKQTKAEKRVAIARDVLRQLAARKFIAESGVYCSIDDADAQKIDATSSDDLQKALKKVKRCNVCALGAAFVSSVLKFDEMPINLSGIGASPKYADGSQYVDTEVDTIAMRIHLRKIFSAKQLAIIECHFEGWGQVTDSMFMPQSQGVAGSDKAVAFHNKHPNAKKRLAVIMQNVIDNGGTFVR